MWDTVRDGIEDGIYATPDAVFDELTALIGEIFYILEVSISEDIVPYVRSEFEGIDAEFHASVAGILTEFEYHVKNQRETFNDVIGAQVYYLQ